MDRPQVVVVGAGVAGLACARELARRRVPVVVLDRARGVGGRCATRHVDGRPVDFGTFYLHAQSAEFVAALGELDPAGRLDGWPERVREPKLACQPDSLLPGRLRLARRDGVSVFPKHLARGLDVRLRQPVTALAEDGAHLRLEVAGAGPLAADIVVAAGAVNESLALVEPLVAGWPGAAPRLERIRAVPTIATLTVMAGYGDAPPPGFDAWFPLEATMLHAIGNDSSKREPGAELVLVLQARPRFSTDYMGKPVEEWTRELVWEASELLGPWAGRPRWTQSHAWTSARVLPQDVLGEAMVFAREPGPAGPRVAVIGDAFAHAAGMEAAYLSGIAMAERIAAGCL
jgi:renalase